MVTLSKIKGGLGLCNLRNARIALLAKHVFSIINKDDKLWVSIFLHKYENCSIWGNVSQPNVSCFHKDILKTLNVIKPNLHLAACNPNLNNIQEDPWIPDIPLSRKTTFINMNLIDNIFINSFVLDGAFNIHECSDLYGANLNHVILKDTIFDNVVKNAWLWHLISSYASTVAVIYDYLNSESLNSIVWKVWCPIW